MKCRTRCVLFVLAFCLGIGPGASTLRAQGSAFTYQGQLQNNGSLANGSYNLQFLLYTTNVGGTAVAGPVATNNVLVSNGLFTVTVDFGSSVWNGTNNWLEIDVETNGGSSFNTLAPRQQVTPVPYAIAAQTSSNLSGVVSVGQLSGLIGNNQLANNSITVAAGTGLNGGGTIALGGSTTLSNAGVTSLTGGGGVTVSAANGDVTLGSTATSSNSANTIVSRDSNGSFSAGNITLSNNLVLGSASIMAPLTAPPRLPASAIGTVATAGGAGTLAVAGDYVYVVSQNDFQIFDVSIPTNPINVSSLSIGGSGPITVAGRYAYIAGSGGYALQVFDVSNPANPVNTGSAGTAGGGGAIGMAVSGHYAYIANGVESSSVLQVFDVSNPSNPINISSVSIAGAQSFAMAGHYVYIANYGAASLQIIDVSNPSNPVNVANIPGAWFPFSIAVAGHFAYMVSMPTNSLEVFDVSDPINPVSVVSVLAHMEPISVGAAGRYAYIVGIDAIGGPQNALKIFDVGNPANPIDMGSIATGSGPLAVAVAGRYAYVANAGGSLQVFDLGGGFVQQFEAGTIETGTLQARDSVAVGNNLDITGGLTVSGSARISGGLSIDNGTITGNGSGLTGLITPGIANYIHSYSTTTQAVVTVNTFQNITNEIDVQINGWAHTAGTVSYTNNQSGLFLIHYTAEAITTASTTTTVSVRAVDNGTEIPDSQCTAVANTANQTVPISKGFLTSFNSGDVLQFQFAGSSTDDRIVSNFGMGTTKPSFSITIVRVQ